MVKLRKYRRRGEPTGEWEVDVRVELPNGRVFRQRVVYRDSLSKAEARAWGEEREHHVKVLARQGMDIERIVRSLRGDDASDPEVMTVESAIEAWLGQREAEDVSTFEDEHISLRCRVAYALEFLTGLRTGQVSALRWGDYEPAVTPLGKLTSPYSYNSRR